MLLQENTVVADRYRLSRMIGRGGMGSVWQAQHLGLNAPCAIKFIEGELANVAEAHARFEREAQAAAKLRGNKHVVQVYDHGVWQGMPYIAMELLDGQDLGHHIADAPNRRLSAAEVVGIMKQVCKVLAKAHGAGIVHRDLKPDNIFLTRDDEDDQKQIAKILDFGVAKSTSQAIDGSNTKTGAMLGTPYYMSPEQAQGIKSVDARSDLWSLAVIVFQCITGRLPFESEALGDLLVKIIVSPIPTPSEYFAGVPVGFDTWWRKAADRNPDNRFQTAKEFADSLGMALGQSSVTDVTQTRQALQKLGGGTALMASPPATKSNPPGNMVQTAALATTPNPAQQSGPHAPMMQTPQPGAHPIMTPQGMTPITNPNLSTNNPVVNDQPIELPTKKPSMGIMIGAIAGFLVVGAIGVTFAVMAKSKATTASGEPVTSASVAAAAEAPAASTPAAKNADPPPAPTNETPPPAASSVASASPPASAPPSPPPVAAKPPGAAVAVKPAAPPPPKPPQGTAPAKPGPKKPADLGF